MKAFTVVNCDRLNDANFEIDTDMHIILEIKHIIQM